MPATNTHRDERRGGDRGMTQGEEGKSPQGQKQGLALSSEDSQRDTREIPPDRKWG